MGEYVWTSVTVGGKATTAILETDLVDAAASDFPGDNGGAGEAADIIADAMRDGTSVTFQGEVNYGNPDTLTIFCRENGLTYHKSWGARGGVFDAGVEFWAPGMEGPEEQDANDDGEPMASLSWLRQQQEAGKDLAAVIAEVGRAAVSNVPALEADDLLSRMESLLSRMESAA